MSLFIYFKRDWTLGDLFSIIHHAYCLFSQRRRCPSSLCILRKQLDPSTGRLRWGMPAKDRCACHRVVAPTFTRTPSCSGKPAPCSPYKETVEMWYIDDSKWLTRKENWNMEKLDQLLERKGFCGRLIYS